MKARSLAVALVATLVGLLSVPVAAPRTAAPAATTVTVTMTEFKFALSKKTVPKGSVTFKLVNKGKIDHDFKISGKKSKLIKPGKSGSLTVTLTKGSKAYICTVKGHVAGGMKGTLKVT